MQIVEDRALAVAAHLGLASHMQGGHRVSVIGPVSFGRHTPSPWHVPLSLACRSDRSVICA
eukprot:5018964-Alexandrium_andersonii.AAC.1